MKKLKNNFLNTLIKCWKEIYISDKALIIIMLILLIQSIHNLFTPEPIEATALSINIIVRTSIASIFGYFLSENFLKNEAIKSKKSNIIVPLNKTEVDGNKSEDNTNNLISNDNNPKNLNTDLKEYICNKTLQIIVALTVCIISLLSLIIGNSFNLIPSSSNPTVIQFRDLISACIGFLVGHSSNSTKK